MCALCLGVCMSCHLYAYHRRVGGHAQARVRMPTHACALPHWHVSMSHRQHGRWGACSKVRALHARLHLCQTVKPRSCLHAISQSWTPSRYGCIAHRLETHCAKHNKLPCINSCRACDAMNSLYTSGVCQTTSIQADLERLRSGESSVSLLSMQRTTNNTQALMSLTLR